MLQLQIGLTENRRDAPPSPPNLSISVSRRRTHAVGFAVDNYYIASTFEIMVHAAKGIFISCDIPMAQFIINYNASLPQSQKFIIHILDGTHLFVSSNVDGMIRSAIQEFREKNTYEKPA
ncbi:hypothetical protein R6Q57_016723 [Mikania cordata]